MKDKLDPAAKIIAIFGKGSVFAGIPIVAEITGRDPTTVHRWMYPKNERGTGGAIPMSVAPKLLQAARKRRLKLTAEDFFTVA